MIGIEIKQFMMSDPIPGKADCPGKWCPDDENPRTSALASSCCDFQHANAWGKSGEKWGTKNKAILLMDKILHHQRWLKPYK